MDKCESNASHINKTLLASIPKTCQLWLDKALNPEHLHFFFFFLLILPACAIRFLNHQSLSNFPLCPSVQGTSPDWLSLPYFCVMIWCFPESLVRFELVTQARRINWNASSWLSKPVCYGAGWLKGPLWWGLLPAWKCLVITLRFQYHHSLYRKFAHHQEHTNCLWDTKVIYRP